MTKRTLQLTVSVLAIVVGVYSLVRVIGRDDGVGTAPAGERRIDDESPDRPAPPAPQSVRAATSADAKTPETLPAPAPETTPRDGYLAYPDGTWLPPLNGVTAAPRIVFHPRLAPFTKVVGRVRDAQGREWYLHENGARSTTYLDGSGRPVADVQMPTTQQPVLPEESGR